MESQSSAPTGRTIKHRLILGIGREKIFRPRELQQAAETDEHHVVHALYLLREEGLVKFKVKMNAHRPGRNIYDIHLTQRGIAKYEELQRGQ